MKLNRSWSIGMIFSLVLAFPTSGAATPIDWQGQWNVQLDQNQVMGVGTKQRAFGVSATLDGQSVDLMADIALARAEAVVLAADSFAAASVDFERFFRLSGSPNGWLVGLQGVLTGSLFIVTDPGMLGEANIIGKADIFDNNGNPAGLSVGITKTRQALGLTAFTLDLSRDSAVLDDGNYSIKGRLKAAAVSDLPPRGQSPPVIAQSLFFNGGWEVSISATPVPEPSTPLLIGAALAVMAATRRKNALKPDPSQGGSAKQAADWEAVTVVAVQKVFMSVGLSASRGSAIRKV